MPVKLNAISSTTAPYCSAAVSITMPMPAGCPGPVDSGRSQATVPCSSHTGVFGARSRIDTTVPIGKGAVVSTKMPPLDRLVVYATRNAPADRYSSSNATGTRALRR